MIKRSENSRSWNFIECCAVCWAMILSANVTHKHTYGLERSLVNPSLLGLKPPVQHTFESTRSLVWSPLMIRPRDQMLRSADLHRQENPLLFTKQLQTVWTKICVFSLESRIVYFWAVRESEQIPGQTLMEDCSCCCCVADALFLLFVQGVAGYTDAAKEKYQNHIHLFFSFCSPAARACHPAIRYSFTFIPGSSSTRTRVQSERATYTSWRPRETQPERTQTFPVTHFICCSSPWLLATSQCSGA